MSTAAVIQVVDEGHYQREKKGETGTELVCRVDGEQMPCRTILRARKMPQGNVLKKTETVP